MQFRDTVSPLFSSPDGPTTPFQPMPGFVALPPVFAYGLCWQQLVYQQAWQQTQAALAVARPLKMRSQDLPRVCRN